MVSKEISDSYQSKKYYEKSKNEKIYPLLNNSTQRIVSTSIVTEFKSLSGAVNLSPNHLLVMIIEK